MTTTERPIRITQTFGPCKSFGPKGYTITTRCSFQGYIWGGDLYSGGTKREMMKDADKQAAALRAQIIDAIGG